jgi:hypothetical protein
MVLSLTPVLGQVEIRDIQGECADLWVQWQVCTSVSGGEKLTGKKCVVAYFPYFELLSLLSLF